jgi:hypothetical protein
MGSRAKWQNSLSVSPVHDSVRIETDTEFYQMDILQLAPNGKIYVSCWAGGSYKMHIINQPDSLGLACDFQFLGQPVLTQSPVALPYFPNFRLGAVAGSSCDTLTEIQSIAQAHPAFASVAPNPASDHAEIIYYTGSYTTNHAVMYDIAGREVWSADVSGSSGSINVNVSSFPAGIYMVKFTADGQPLMSSKLAVMRDN